LEKLQTYQIFELHLQSLGVIDSLLVKNKGEQMRKAFMLNQNKVEVEKYQLINLGLKLYLKMGRLREGREWVEDTHKIKEDTLIKDNQPDTLMLMGELYYKNKEIDQAIHYYEKAIELRK
jgi:tetratricopeptide (TPR) repeat protein